MSPDESRTTTPLRERRRLVLREGQPRQLVDGRTPSLPALRERPELRLDTLKARRERGLAEEPITGPQRRLSLDTGGIRLDMAPPTPEPQAPTFTEQVLTALRASPRGGGAPHDGPLDVPHALLERAYGLSEWFRRRPAAGDWMLAVVAFVAASLVTSVLGLPGFIVDALMTLPLAIRRRQPMLAMALVTLGGLLQVALMDIPTPGNMAALAVMFSAAANGSRRARVTALTMGLLAAAVSAYDWGRGNLLVAAYLTPLLGLVVALVWVLGDVLRHRREVIAREVEQREAIERDREQRAKIAQREERGAIAREMHDIIAHSLSVVVVQADAGAFLAASDDPEALAHARRTLQTIGETAREALGETRRIVGVLREPGKGADYAPQQSLTMVPTLVERLEGGGVEVDLAVEGELEGLPKEIDLAAYRVVQEATTNVLKHAGEGARVTIRIRRSDDELSLLILDDGRGAEAVDDGRGHGVIGMRERVAVFGGRLVSGPRAGGGYRVRAELPLPTTTGGHQ